MVKVNITENELNEIMDQIQTDKIQKIVVGAVIDMGDNNFLLLKRRSDDFMGELVELPSGTVETGETLIEALIREIYEETGLHIISIDKYIGVFDYLSGSGKKTRQVNFKVTPFHTYIQLSQEHKDYYVCSYHNKKLTDLNISQETLSIIKSSFLE